MTNPKTIGRYEIVDELGHGAMGAVFRARDPAMDRIVALKTILAVALASQQSDEYRQRFYREARAAGALAHPGIVPVFDVGEHEGMPFLVMEFVNGQTLADAMKSGDRATIDRVCEIGQQIADALGYAHRKGVIHRDIKPANILLTSREIYGVERPRITDFGVAKITAGEITTTGQLLGTPAFMPPEQFTGALIDGRTDLFSLGVILYAMATGELPFPGETMTTVSYKIVHTEPVPPGRLNPAIPAQLDRLILKCLAKSPSDRFQTGEELAQALGEVRTGATPASLRTTTPQTIFAGGGSEDTLDGTPSFPPNRVSNSGPASFPATSFPPPPGSFPPGPIPPGTIPAGSLPPGSIPAASYSAAAAAAGQPRPAAKAPHALKRIGPLVAMVVLFAAIAAGGWYKYQHRGQPPIATQQLQQPMPTPTPAPVPAAPPATPPAPAAAPAPAPAEKPAVKAGGGKPAQKPPAKPPAATPAQKAPAPPPAAPPAAPAPNSSAAPKPAASGPQTQLAPVPFNPKTLDSKQNAKLKIDLDHFPAALGFIVEMNGMIYYKGTAADKADYENLFVPPGEQQFRVAVVSGKIVKISNTMSVKFAAKKHLTLKVQLQPQVTGTGTITADTKVAATLKMDLFQF